MADAIPNIFLDTNTLLHFRRPDLLDWKTFVPGNQVVLVVCPALIDELEAIKADPRRPAKLRERAHKSIMWLSEMIELPEPIQLIPGVQLTFITESPTIDFAAHRLSYTVSDDQLIASAIQYRNQTSTNVSFFTNDTGLRLKLRNRSMTCFTLPPSERLPEELDEDTRKIRALEAQIASYKNRQPKLALTFDDGSNSAKIKLRQVPEPDPPMTYFPFAISRPTLERYQKKHAAYQTKYESWANQVVLRFSIGLLLTNEGTAAASDILITLSFADFITVMPNHRFLKEPTAPERPTNPILGVPKPLEQAILPIIPPPQPPRQTEPHISAKDNTVAFRIPTLVHGRTVTLDKFFVKFDSKDAVKNHSFDYSVSLVEYPEEIDGKLHVILDNTHN